MKGADPPRRPLAEARGEAVPHLVGSLGGEGDTEQPFRHLAGENQIGHPPDQRLGLSRAGPGQHQQRRRRCCRQALSWVQVSKVSGRRHFAGLHDGRFRRNIGPYPLFHGLMCRSALMLWFPHGTCRLSGLSDCRCPWVFGSLVRSESEATRRHRSNRRIRSGSPPRSFSTAAVRQGAERRHAALFLVRVTARCLIVHPRLEHSARSERHHTACQDWRGFAVLRVAANSVALLAHGKRSEPTDLEWLPAFEDGGEPIKHDIDQCCQSQFATGPPERRWTRPDQRA